MLKSVVTLLIPLAAISLAHPAVASLDRPVLLTSSDPSQIRRDLQPPLPKRTAPECILPTFERLPSAQPQIHQMSLKQAQASKLTIPAEESPPFLLQYNSQQQLQQLPLANCRDLR